MSEQVDADILIIGAGAIGCSIARELVQRGEKRVMIVDRGSAGSGSSSKATGGFREQFSTDINIRFSQMSKEYFRNAIETLGGPIGWTEPGYIFLARSEEQAAAFARNVELQRSLGVDSYLMTPDDLERNWPWLRPDGVVAASWCPDDALFDQVAYMNLLAERTRDEGVEIREGVTVQRILTANGRVTGVETNEGALTAGTVILAAGAWSQALGETVGLHLPVKASRREIYTFTPVTGLPDNMPFIADFDIGAYIRQEATGYRISGRLDGGESEDPNVDPAGGKPTLEWGSSLVPQLGKASLTGGWAGLTEVTPDHHALLGNVDGIDGLVIATGFSGHGLMHAPATGLLVAELILDGRAHSLDITALSPQRFERGEALAETMIARSHEQGDIVVSPADR